MFRWSVTVVKAPPSTRSIASNVSRFIKSYKFRLGLNCFADEFRSKFLGFRSTGRHCHISNDSLPSSIDWGEKGAVVGVKNQSSSFFSFFPRPFLDLMDHLNLKKLYGDGQALVDKLKKRFPFDLSVSVLSCNTAPAADERSEEEVRLFYKEWLLKHNKSDEKGSRFPVFRDNLKFIDKHNAAADAGEKTHRLGLNCFSDLTFKEFRSKYYPPRSLFMQRQAALLRSPAKPNRAFVDADGMHSSS